ncbi:CBS domain containing-hemolysin-like protein [Motilibacter rhizosphaerae]|uniref:CBS domain containing-hemolysin-like protein n=1 Tax=Motilibacter rhizosphaerae TaxID=598652 RepID=A0A4V2F4H0_9ACTN|nr:hemolysin family protein [Motilibacter rhizosphaerae]RZS87577.1 CBS domain containing-hemolysin-like protein [Motilibacter rhizosphaerae]
MSPLLAAALSALLLAGNAFFVAAEFALVSARRSAIEPLAEGGSRRARQTLAAMEDVSRMLAGAQLGVTACSLGLGALAEPAVADVLHSAFEAVSVPEALVHPVAFVVALGAIAYLHIVLGEMVPKNLSMAGPDGAVLVLAPALQAFVRVTSPLIAVLGALANGSVRLLRVEPRSEVTSAYTRDEVAGLVEQSRREGLLDKEEERLVLGALTFEERTARHVLLPLPTLVTVDARATRADVEQTAARTGYSRFPVRRGGQLVGYVHVKDALAVVEDERQQPLPAEAVRPMPSVAPEAPLRQVLLAMQGDAAHLAQVQELDGTVLGVVALEDVIEELVGEVRDEVRGGVRVGTRP